MRDEFLVAAYVPRSARASGTLEAADAVLAGWPEVAVGDLSLVERALVEPSDWTPHHSSEILDMLRPASA